jgi:branched-chain amino acid aminotransferase
MSIFASVDGSIVPGTEARVSVLDNGFTFGDAVYETLRTVERRPLRLAPHLTRLRQSAERLGIALPISDAELTARLRALLDHAGHKDSYIRFMVSRGVGDISYNFERVTGPTVVIVVKPYEGYPPAYRAEGVALALVSVRRNHPLALDPAIKSCNLLNNILAIREAQAKGAMEAVLLNHDGEVAECAGSNIFAVRDGRAVTPPLSAGILPGITRDIVLELAAAGRGNVREETLTVDALMSADEVFITSSLKDVMPVRTIDGRTIGDGRPGPVTRAIAEAFREALPSLCAPL